MQLGTPEDALLVVRFRINRHDLAAMVLAALGARPMRLRQLAAGRALHQLGRGQILVAAAIATAVARHFALRYSTHD